MNKRYTCVSLVLRVLSCVYLGLGETHLYFTLTSAIFESRSGRGVQHNVIKFVSDLRQVGCFLRVFRFPAPIN
jgi:hypothetical protein